MVKKIKLPKFLKDIIKENIIVDRYIRDATALAGIMDFSCADISEIQQHPERVNQSGSQTINWYVPPFENAFYGGVMTILRTADYLHQHGKIKQRFLICGDSNAEVMLTKITNAFPNLNSAEVIILNSIEAIQNIPASDFSIATLWTTAYVLLKVKNTGLKFYFIQDFEPLFYPAGSTYAQAEATYRFGFYGIANTISLRKIYETEYAGIATHFTPCVDTKVFYPDSSLKKNFTPKRVFFYGRPGHPRNGFELAVEAMRKLKTRYGSQIEILSAGADWKPKEYGLEGVIENLGLLSYEETGNLYRSCHVGLSMMMTKHPSYLPFEMMACGVLVVSNINSSTQWLLKDRENCLLSHPSASCIAETISEAIDKYDEFDVIRNNAVNCIKDNHADWSVEIQKIHDFIQYHAIKYSNCLVQSNGNIFGSAVFVVNNGYRHYVPDLDWIIQHGFIWPTDVQVVSDEVLLSLLPGRPAPHKWTLEDWVNPPRKNSLQMREISASRLSGNGIEVGAAWSPFPIPLDCRVKYVDILPKDTLNTKLRPGEEIINSVQPDLIGDLETLEEIEDNSLDFIVACHVIEHTRNPINALKTAYKKLRIGGFLVLVIPDKNRTFDRQRNLTTLDHLILDYQSPSKERDREHYVEFLTLAFPVPEENLASTVEKSIQEQADIHYHTFTYESFSLLISYVCKNICPWSSVWSQPTLSNSTEDMEFYFVLTK
ncbi:glycosyltransferase [Anabaena sp. CCY 9910]|uniref:rhamnosyltransferase WsaF family glycosyltransferase n=1 Tax=Anabaena sp. CCY 9910 TaxID=3103870 RepID=UPI0039E178D9